MAIRSPRAVWHEVYVSDDSHRMIRIIVPGWRRARAERTGDRTGAQPSANLDTSFFESLSIQGYVPASKRGSVSGTATGVPSNFQAVLHWYNSAAQYWTIASPLNGSYTSPLMKPGTYSMKLYRGEYVVAQDTVIITAGGKATKDIASTDPNPTVVWRIGNFDGQPFELKNGGRIERMHPSDVRMGTWGGSYTVGKSSPKDFPMALFSKQGGVATVNFKVSKEQAASDNLTLRVGTTLSFKGGRPSVKIGSWQGKDPGATVSRVIQVLSTTRQILILRTEIDRFPRCDTRRLPRVRRSAHMEGADGHTPRRRQYADARRVWIWGCQLPQRQLHCRCRRVARAKRRGQSEGLRAMRLMQSKLNQKRHPRG